MSPPHRADCALPEDRSRSLRSLRSPRPRRCSPPPPSRHHPAPSSSRPPSPRGASSSFSGGAGGVVVVVVIRSRRCPALLSSGWGKMTGPPRPPPAMSFPSGDVVVTPFIGADDEKDGTVAPPQGLEFFEVVEGDYRIDRGLRTN